MIVSFFPMLCIAAAVLLPQPRRPGLRHHLHLGRARRWDPQERLDRGLGDHRRRRPRSCRASPTSRAVYTFHLFGWDPAAANKLGDPCVRRHLDRRHDLDLRGRRRALGAHAADPARRSRSSRSRSCSPSWRSTRSTPRTRRLDPSGALLVQPVRHLLGRPPRGGVLLGVFIYWGWDWAWPSTRRARIRPGVPASSAMSRRSSSWRIYVLVTTAAQAFAGPQLLIDNPYDILLPRSARACSGRCSTSS